MSSKIESLPDDPVALKALLIKQKRKIHVLQSQLDELNESLRFERYRKYGKSSEKDPGQEELFDEAEQLEPESIDSEVNEESDIPDSGNTTKRKKKRKSRKPLPADLPRIKKVIELDASERQCSCGCELTEIGQEISEQLDIIPVQVQVIQTI